MPVTIGGGNYLAARQCNSKPKESKGQPHFAGSTVIKVAIDNFIYLKILYRAGALH